MVKLYFLENKGLDTAAVKLLGLDAPNPQFITIYCVGL